MPKLSRFVLQQGLWALITAVCILFSLEPFGIWPLGFVAVLATLRAAGNLEQSGWSRLLITYALFASAVSFIAFGWIIGTIHRYTGEHVFLTLFLSLLYAALFQTKFLLFFAANRLLKITGSRDMLTMLFLAAILALCDAIAPELFLWSWGNLLAAEAHLRQLASVGSVYFLGFNAALGGVLLHHLSLHIDNLRQSARTVLPVAVLFILAFSAGVTLRYTLPRGDRELTALAIQTNIGAVPEAKRSDRDFATDAINRLFNQSLDGFILAGRADILLWAEGSMPFHASTAGGRNAEIYSPTFDGVLEYLQRISGAAIIYQDLYRDDRGLHSRLAARPEQAWPQQYLKRRLVPWGEFLPFESVSPSLRRFFPEAGHLTAGRDGNEMRLVFAGKPLPLPSRERMQADVGQLSSPEKIRRSLPAPVAGEALIIKPLLCYEALFPSDSRRLDADLLVNLASDAWFGDGIEGAQHAGAVTLRAVENGVPMIRAAMTGISFAVDAGGDFLSEPSGQARPAVLRAQVPRQKRQTVFSRFGMAAFYGLMLAACWPYLLSLWLNRYSKK